MKFIGVALLALFTISGCGEQECEITALYLTDFGLQPGDESLGVSLKDAIAYTNENPIEGCYKIIIPPRSYIENEPISLGTRPVDASSLIVDFRGSVIRIDGEPPWDEPRGEEEESDQ